MPTNPAPSKAAHRKDAKAASGKSTKAAAAKTARRSAADVAPTAAVPPAAPSKTSSAIWVSPEAHRLAKVAVSFMIGTGEDKFRNLTLGVFAELAILDAMERFYAARGMSMAKIKILRAILEERLRQQ